MAPTQMRRFAVGVVSFVLVQPLHGQSKELPVEGVFVHASRQFPEQVGDFRRWKVTEYGPDDISVGYNMNSRSRAVAATVFLYPLPNIPFDHELAAIQEGHSKFKLLSQEDVILENGPKRLQCRLAAVSYEEWFAGRNGTVGSCLVVCDDPPWRIKWRVTHLPISDSEILDVIKELAGPLTVRD